MAHTELSVIVKKTEEFIEAHKDEPGWPHGKYMVWNQDKKEMELVAPEDFDEVEPEDAEEDEPWE